MTARVDLAVAQLRTGDLEAAKAAVEPVLALPCPRRVSSLRYGFARMRAELGGARHQRWADARDLDAQIEQFRAHTIASHLTDTPRPAWPVHFH